MVIITYLARILLAGIIAYAPILLEGLDACLGQALARCPD